MTTQEKIESFKNWQFACTSYQLALGLSSFDQSTIAPKDGGAYAYPRLAYLSGELFSLQTNPEMIELVKDLSTNEEVDEDLREECKTIYKEVMKIVGVPKDEYVAYQQLTREAEDAWNKAKSENNFPYFEPYLKRMIESTKKFYSYRNTGKTPYEDMLDDYEPGMTIELYDHFFQQVQEKLVPLIQKVKDSKPIDTSFIYKNYPVDQQRQFMSSLLKYLNFDPSWGYLGETEHPFTHGLSRNDVRITTRYIENNVSSAIFSTIHEAGHAFYEHQVNPAYDGTQFRSMSSAIHESQSRLLENYFGRDLSFWEYNYPILQDIFKDQLGNVSVQSFVDALNASSPSLIRTDADELTYPIHILIRYELEKGLFNGTISTDHLDERWNAMYDQYLGIHSDTARDGILQDIHWADGLYGYFPTYALGSAFSAQYYNTMKNSFDIHEAMRNNEFHKITDWLKENVHQYGSRYDSLTVLKKATKEDFNAQYYFDYLTNKYTKLYNL